MTRAIVLTGYLCRMFGWHQRAENLARKAIREDESHFAAWRLLGMELADRADGCPPDLALEQEAKNAFKTAYNLAPKNFYVACNLCSYLTFLGEIGEARRVASEYTRIDKSRGGELLADIRHAEKHGSTRGQKKGDAYSSCDESQPPNES